MSQIHHSNILCELRPYCNQDIANCDEMANSPQEQPVINEKLLIFHKPEVIYHLGLQGWNTSSNVHFDNHLSVNITTLVFTEKSILKGSFGVYFI